MPEIAVVVDMEFGKMSGEHWASRRQSGNNPESHKLSGQALSNAVTVHVKLNQKQMSGNATTQAVASEVTGDVEASTGFVRQRD